MIGRKPLIAVDLREARESPRADLFKNWRSCRTTPLRPNHSTATKLVRLTATIGARAPNW